VEVGVTQEGTIVSEPFFGAPTLAVRTVAGFLEVVTTLAKTLVV
jgi:hypothetical protein